MSNDKTPGQDGLPADFYKVFWGRIKGVFYNMMLECYKDKELCQSAREGILNLIPKPNKDSRYIKNLRPITLLNTDYKIIEKAIANKIEPTLKHIIHTDQRGFMKDRRISVNIRKFLDIMDYAKNEDLDAVVLSLDFVKCFDKCSFTILHGSLDFYGFGQIVKDWTKVLYQDFRVRVQNNGHFSEDIKVRKGVHQGGCCSSLYFLLIAEILAMTLRQDERIEGITIQQIRQLLNQFADDMDIFSICSQKSILAILSNLKEFYYQSSFTVSYDKTALYRIGSLRHSNAKMYNIDDFIWTNEDINVLGVTIAHEDLLAKNYLPLIGKVNTTLNAWYNRNLSLLGKIQVVNTLVASQFVYKQMVLPNMPSNIIKCIDNSIRNFIWNGGKSKIAYQILQNPKDLGGVNLVNIRSREIALKASWPQILSYENQYQLIVYSIMRCSRLGNDIWRCSLLDEDIHKMKFDRGFWRDILECWSKYNFLHNFRVENQVIWYNSRCRLAGKPFIWNDILDKGLKFVYQLFVNQQFITYEAAWEEFGLNKLRYNSLKKVIPSEWIKFYTTAADFSYSTS